ncbi:MAG: YfjI family protein [Actinomycetota bacterium]|nr:YfjI family protein [Actinomycetota bacterium]
MLNQPGLFALDDEPPPRPNGDSPPPEAAPALLDVPAALAVPPPPPGWPDPPADAAYGGLVGDIVAALAPHTEADPVAILAQALVAAGVAIGRGAHFAVEASLHHPNEYVLVVGESAKARKGSSWDHVARLMNTADPGFATRTSTGLSSGEGLVWALRDPAGADPGAADPRLLVVEAEFASVLKMTARDVNTLSPVLRSAWDGRPLALLTRTAPARAGAAHLGVIGHITAAELAHHVTGLEAANGLLNRFLIIAVRRARLLPEGGHPDPLGRSRLPAALAANLDTARNVGRLRLSAPARRLWWDTYPTLSAAIPGPAGALTARAEAHTVRLALLYALTDGARSISAAHLRAGLALWDYAARSAAWAAGQANAGPLAERVADALIAAGPDGLTRTQIRDTLGRNASGANVDAALAALATHHRAQVRTNNATGGRPARTWTAAETPALC